MQVTPTIQSLSASLDHWQFLYVLAITIALLSTFAIVVFAFHIQERRIGLKISNYVYVVASLLAVVATIVIVYKTKSLDAEKDRELQRANNAAQIEIGNAKAEASEAEAKAEGARQKAEEARLKAETTSKENASLRIDLAKHETQEHEAEAKLATQGQQLTQFTQGLAQQQNGMAQQMQTTASLNDAQVEMIATRLRPLTGKTVHIRVMMDARSSRLGSQFNRAFNEAGIRVEEHTTMVGPDYHGIIVLVKNQKPPFPPLAQVLLDAILSSGIMPHFSYDPSITDENTIFLCIGPE